jgi:iron complex outermembrane receptor protein
LADNKYAGEGLKPMKRSHGQQKSAAQFSSERFLPPGARILKWVLAVGLTVSAISRAQDPAQPDLSRMDLEDLMKVKITSVSKREQQLSRTAAAAFVINQEEIRRSGATSIPDLLRIVPGVDVQQIDANAWAISIRGFNSRYSNKVLVLIDGRTVYSPSFSGVFWEQIDTPLENIDRIEVIRGPGATVWGANAVNGVISIFTKSSNDTKGALVSAAAGSQIYDLGTLQYGGSAGNSGAYRVFGNHFDIGNAAMANGSPANDHWMRSHAGFRSDWDLSRRDSLVVEGDLFANEANQTRRGGFIPTPYDPIFNQRWDATGGNALARWSHTLDGGSQTSLQGYYDTDRRTDFGVPEVLRTFDLDFQHHITPGDRHEMVWGLGYRVSDSILSPGYFIGFTPPSETSSLFSGFFQDEIQVSDSLWLTVGSKVEHNRYTGMETEPSVRLVWNVPGSRHTIWVAASKAIRQPARADTGIAVDLQEIPVSANSVQLLRLFGNPRVKAEELRDYELGYRSEFSRKLSFDVATFLSFYRHLETIEPQPLRVIPGSPLKFEIPMLVDGKAHAVDYGGEAFFNWTATSRWHISPGYSYLHASLRQDPSSQGTAGYSLANGFPQNIFQVRSLVNLSRRTEFDQSLYYTARLPGSSIPGHARLDLRLARRLGESTEISVVGQNLLRPRTPEYGDSYGLIGTQAVRSVYGKITWRF